MVYGSLIRIFILLMAVLCEFYALSTFTLFFIILSIIAYQVSQGSLAWVYVSEVAQDQAFGVCVLAQ